jgi:hypothetical protein
MVGQTLSGGKQPRVTHRGVGFFAFLIVFAVTYFGEPSTSYRIPITGGLIFTPTFIAVARSHRNTTAIFVVNLLMLGGLLASPDDLLKLARSCVAVGWVITLVWSFTANRDYGDAEGIRRYLGFLPKGTR